ncbi:NAD(P)H-quinone oxidoreductase [Ruegeria sp. ANG-S4]|uniref:NAD(P)H-quinone oxidoreductase n=1 Tax=Ruegeria sp. ANG-S4 TaxID=1577904 RepID=UPI00057D67D2|nr:NAD(P)H-quinone oxidoreductase [Ruegeria sp. ANG-S4]KIC45975.1 NAD(P)H-quinone oxidoreductase [Ruegeria sp. ANG-S4]
MAAVSAQKGGDAESLEMVRRPVPAPGPGEVLIKVAGAGLNRGDILQRNRTYPAPDGTQYDVLGLEVSGYIAAVGEGVETWVEGDAVCALMKDGGYAEYALADAPLVLPVPRGVDVVEAAALPEAYFTVWTNVFQRGTLKAGQSILVHGGSSGIGVTAIQLANAFGATVYATAGSTEKCAVCETLGAVSINYRECDFVEAIQDLTGGQGVDLVLDIVAGSYLQRNLNALSVEGTLVMIGLMEGLEANLNIGLLLTRRLTITGSTLWARSIEQKAAIGRELADQVWPLFEKGKLKPIVSSRFKLGDAVAAHQLMEAGQHVGKILLETEHSS